MEKKICGMGVAKDPAGHHPCVNVENVRHQALDLRLIKKTPHFLLISTHSHLKLLFP
jgi:hypothetical protein